MFFLNNFKKNKSRLNLLLSTTNWFSVLCSIKQLINYFLSRVQFLLAFKGYV